MTLCCDNSSSIDFRLVGTDLKSMFCKLSEDIEIY